MIRISDRMLLFGGTFLSQVLRIMSAMAVARLLPVKYFGQFQTFVGIAGWISFGDFGVYRVLTSRQDLPVKELMEAATVVTIGAFGLPVLLSVASGIFCAWYLSNDQLLAVGILNAVGFAAQGYYGLQVAALGRDLRFTRMAGAEAAIGVALALASVALAAAGAGIFTLVVPPVLAQLAAVLLLRNHVSIRWPRRWKSPELWIILRFGWREAIFVFVRLFCASLYFLVISFVSAPGITTTAQKMVASGVFSKILGIVGMFGFNLALALEKVVFLLMCKSQDDRQRFNALFIRGSAALLAVTGFGAMFYQSLGPDLVYVVLGPAWGAVPPLLSLYSWSLWSIGTSVLCLSVAMIDQQPIVGTIFYGVHTLLMAPCAWCYHAYGPSAYCLALCVSQGCATAVLLAYTIHKHRISAMALVGRIVPLVIVLLMTGGAMWGTRLLALQWLPQTDRLLPSLLRLVIAGTAGGAVYLGGLMLVDRSTFQELRNMFRRRAASPPVDFGLSEGLATPIDAG